MPKVNFVYDQQDLLKRVGHLKSYTGHSAWEEKVLAIISFILDPKVCYFYNSYISERGHRKIDKTSEVSLCSIFGAMISDMHLFNIQLFIYG